MFKNFFNLKSDYRKKMFTVLAAAGVISNLFGLIANSIIFGLCLENAACGLCAIIVMIAALYGYRTGKTGGPTAIILCLTTIYEFPMLFLSFGPSAIPYLFLSLMCILVFSPKGTRTRYFAAATLYDFLIIILRNVYIEYVPTFDTSSYFSAGLCSFSVTAITVYFIMTIYIAQYELQNNELKKTTNELRTANRLDPMTGLFNRIYLSEYCTELIEANTSFCAALLDLDNCRKMNEDFGVPYTDKVITEFASIVNNAVSASGVTARFSGQKFMVIFRGDVGRLEDLLDNVRKEYAAYSMNEKQCEFTFSGGIEEYDDGMELSMLYNCVEEKLARAKKQGKNRVVS